MVVRRLGRMLWWGIAAIIVGLAVTLSAARLLLPGMSEYQEQVITLVEGAINRKVEIATMDAAWHRFSPMLRLQQVVIHDKAFPEGQLDIGEIQVGLDVIGSLMNRKWLTSGIRIIGVQLALQTDLSGKQADAVNMEAFYWLMRQKNVSLEQVKLDWQDPALPDRHAQFSGLSAQLRSDGWRHQFFVQTDVNEYYGKRIELAADLSGPLKSPEDWRGRVYLKTEDFRLQSVQSLAETLGYSTEGEVDLEVWARVRDRQLKWSAGSVSIAQPRFSRRDESGATFEVDELSSRFKLRAIRDGWNLELQNFGLLRDEVPVWPETRLRAVVRTGESLGIRGTISHVEVSEASKILPLLPWIDQGMRTRIEHMQPRGELVDTEFDLRLADKAPPGFSLRSRFEHLGVSSYGGLPGATELSGNLEGNLQTGSISFDSRESSLHMPNVFSKVYDLSNLAGRLDWQRLSDRFRVSSDQLLLASDLLNARTRLQLDWLPGQVSPWVDMQLWADELPMAEVKHYLPDRVMGSKALSWLRNAFQRGTTHDVRFLLEGPLDRVPFDQGEGRLEARFDFDGALLNYHPEWGELDALNGSALFAGRSMRITGTSATILDASVDRVVAVIDDLANPVLDIDGTVSGTLESLLAYINYSPLRDRFGKLVDQIKTRGDAALQLGLRIPLRPTLGVLQVNGDVEFQGNSLRPRDSDISLDEVRGVLKFTDQGVKARDVRAKLFKHPVKVSVYPEGSESTQRTVVDIEGKLKLVDMLKKESPRLDPYINGEAYWHALLQIPAGADVSGRSVELKLNSDLKGVATSFPAPFAKAADDAWPVSIGWMPGKLSSDPLVAKLRDDVTFKLLMHEAGNSIRKAVINFGEDDASLPTSDTIQLTGWLDVLNLDAWIGLLRDIASRDVPAADPLPPVSTYLYIRKIMLLGYLAQGLDVSSKADDPWGFTLDGQDIVGQARWTPAIGDAVPMLTLRLEQLTVVPAENDALPASGVALTPERLPGLDLEVGKVQLGPYALGKVAVRGERVAEGVAFPSFHVESEAIEFTGEGSWLQHGEQQSTRFRADITGGELGELVKLFGDSGSIRGGQMKGRASLDWPGTPGDFGLATVEGEISLETGKGRLEEVKEGAGKLLNLFNLNSLQRRITLDFSDLTKEGFSFDKIDGSLVIGDGNAYTENFVIHGTSATIEISGRTGLVDQDYDQLIKMTPQVSSSLPIAGVIAGGPAVGAAVFLAEKLVGKNFNRMAQVRYKVSGTWDEPVYTRLKSEPETDQPLTGDSP